MQVGRQQAKGGRAGHKRGWLPTKPGAQASGGQMLVGRPRPRAEAGVAGSAEGVETGESCDDSTNATYCM